jgi:putative transposase
MDRTPDLYRCHRLPGEIISHAVWLYHTFSLSFRDVELLWPSGA